MTVGNKAFAMKRSTADKLMEGIRERIILANLDSDFACRVDRAAVFRSYVNEPNATASTTWTWPSGLWTDIRRRG